MTVVIQQRIIECPYRRSEIEYHKCTYLLVMPMDVRCQQSGSDGVICSLQVDMGCRQSKG